MATQASFLTPDVANAKSGSLTSGGAASGDLTIGQYKCFRILAIDTTTPANIVVLRGNFYNKKNGNSTVAPTATSAIVFQSNQEVTFDMGSEFDTINLIAADNGTDTIKYTVLTLAKN